MNGTHKWVRMFCVAAAMGLLLVVVGDADAGLSGKQLLPKVDDPGKSRIILTMLIVAALTAATVAVAVMPGRREHMD